MEFGHFGEVHFGVFYAPKGGYRTQPGVSTLGTATQSGRALKGRQIERTNNGAVESNGSRSQLRTLFRATISARPIC
jgi:hypothetical protein